MKRLPSYFSEYPNLRRYFMSPDVLTVSMSLEFQELLPYALGPTIYCPCSKIKLSFSVIDFIRIGIKSYIFCLEDSIADKDLKYSEDNLLDVLEVLSAPDFSRYLFI